MLTVEALRNAPEDDYMNDTQLEFFTDLLRKQEKEILEHLQNAREGLANTEYEIDELDRAQNEEENRLRLRIAEREAKLLPKIREAIKRIEEGSYGYCEITGEPIGIERLLIRPTATLCAEEKARQERLEKNFRDD